MALALYRKYRPQAFSEITGQEHVRTTLERQVAAGKVAHAYLFSGLRGTGKTSMARILAKAVNCASRQPTADSRQQAVSRKPLAVSSALSGEPCNKCEACKIITDGRALDVIEIDAASHTGVDNVRETIVETAKFAPTRLRYKVFIIDEAHMLSNSAWNALLKIMEEPPAHVIFILATTEAHKVPTTILSRCQRFDFRRVAIAGMLARLSRIAKSEKVAVEEEVLRAVARLSEGCMRDAESILEQLFALGEQEITSAVAALVLPRTSIPYALELFEALGARNHLEALRLVNRLMEEGIDLEHFDTDLLELFRKTLLIKVAGEETVAGGLDGLTLEKLKKRAQNFSTEQILFAIEALVKAKQALRTAAIPQLPLEVAVVEICEVGGLGAPSGSVDSAIQGSSSVPPPILSQKGKIGARTADAPKIALPHRQTPPLAKGKNENSTPNPSTDEVRENEEEAKNILIALDEIKNKWPEVLKRAKEENHSLPFLLSASEPLKVEKGVLQIGVQYPFHRDKLNEQKCRTILEQVMGAVYQVPLRVEGVVLAPEVKDTAVSDILSTLGGRVVE